ncbi:hypothetical protein [Gracilimonas sp. BCB1]|uniref:hypothetical protein n=1 Tax=Gracilimonas sp. BCB1 TaxID=3152362 RepID=UPI0032D8BC8E
MIEQAKLNLYEISKCGYFRYGINIPEFGSIDEILESLLNWTSGRELQETSTYGEEQYLNHNSTYCLDIITDRNTGDYILTTWNETPTERGRFASVNRRSAVGEYDIETQEINEDDIPGYATYFWFLPELNHFTTVRFNMSVNGHQQLQLYLRNFMEKYSRFVVDDGGVEGEREIFGYRSNENDDVQNLHPAYESRPHTDQGSLPFLLSRRQDIRKVMKKSVMLYNNEVDSAATFFQNLRIDVENVPEQDEFTVKYEVDFNPSEDALRDLYESWEQEIQNSDNDWDDIGVQFSGNQNDYWFSRILKKAEYDIDVEWENEAVVNARTLMEALLEIREDIIELI